VVQQLPSEHETALVQPPLQKRKKEGKEGGRKEGGKEERKKEKRVPSRLHEIILQ
jgi:hypothetical protein